MSHKGSTDIAHGLDIGDTANAHVQDGEVLSSRSNEHDGLPQEVYIKSEPLYEDLCEVLDELGEILDEEQDDVLDKRQGNNIDRDQGEIMDKEQAELDEEEADTPPAPSISLTDDASLFTRRSRPYADDSPLSFNGSLYEHGEISSSEEGQKEPVRGKNLHEIALVRFRNSPEQSLKRCSINAGFSSENKINRRSNRSTSNEKSATQRRSISRSRIPRQTNYTHTEYSAEYSAGNVTGSFGQPFPELGPYDLRHRLSTTRSLHYVGPNDLRHHIQGIYSHQTAFNAYTEWPSVFTENYHPSGYY
ncbi:GD15048 [Drosophila simulans]|uniref:GD15048 n=1 Tax=Drosophila simulans TaxID=7240 RepID=B4QL97_DROSI|nr:GD15048 [Drosophila simulans]